MKAGCSVADEVKQAPRQPFPGADAFGISLGLIVFAAGILMLILVFRWSYGLFDSIDEEIGKAGVTAAETESDPEAGSTPPAAPADSESPTLAQVAAVVGLRILVLFVMGYAGSLVATKGAQLLAAHRARPTIQ